MWLMSLVVTAAAGGIYAAWRYRQRMLLELAAREAEAKEKLRQHQEALDAIEKATLAQRAVDDTPPDRLRDSDGYRRD